jgi:transposase
MGYLTTDKFKSYNSLSRYAKHYKIDHTKEFRKEKHNHINVIEDFWSYAKKFLINYNGISKKNFYL